MEGETASTAPVLPSPYNIRSHKKFLHLLNNAVSYGESVWKHITSLRGKGTTITPFLNLSYIIEEQLETLFLLCSTTNAISSPLLTLQRYYYSPELKYRQYKMNKLSLFTQIHSTTPKASFINTYNYYAALPEVIEPLHPIVIYSIMSSSTSTSGNTDNHATKSFFVEDLHVSEITDIDKV